MKTLCLLRHAKSSWDDPTIPDHDRPLAPRGVKAARLVGRHLEQQGIRPDLILCSTALRATKTLHLVLAELDVQPPVETERGLYLCGAQALLTRLRKAPDSADTLMLLAHNPDIHDLGMSLAGHGDKEARHALRAKFPTGACAILVFDIAHWHEVERGEGRLTAFVQPRMLA
ncbi:MAG TPA: histidine phosphatase family protein [Azospirillum sp.]|nr:histidine phosphatase family protein [Azospirillum sp.]